MASSLSRSRKQPMSASGSQRVGAEHPTAGFFTAQAYDRWWEAHKIWGELVDDSRCFGRLVSSVFPSADAQPEVAARG